MFDPGYCRLCDYKKSTVSSFAAAAVVYHRPYGRVPYGSEDTVYSELGTKSCSVTLVLEVFTVVLLGLSWYLTL